MASNSCLLLAWLIKRGDFIYRCERWLYFPHGVLCYLERFYSETIRQDVCKENEWQAYPVCSKPLELLRISIIIGNNLCSFSPTFDRWLLLNLRHIELHNIHWHDAEKQVTYWVFFLFWKVCDTKLVNKSISVLPKYLIYPFRKWWNPEGQVVWRWTPRSVL